MAVTCLGMVLGSQPLFLGRDGTHKHFVWPQSLDSLPLKCPRYRPFYAFLYRQPCRCQSHFLQFSGHCPPGAWQQKGAGIVWLVPCSLSAHLQTHRNRDFYPDILVYLLSLPGPSSPHMPARGLPAYILPWNGYAYPFNAFLGTFLSLYPPTTTVPPHRQGLAM